MSLRDTCTMTLDELGILLQEWSRHEEARYRERWEQVRFLAHKVLLPYAKKGLSLTDVARFAWEPEPDHRPVSREKFKKMVERFGEH